MPLITFDDPIGVPEQTNVWRYMKLHRFQEFIDTSRLHLTRLDKFNDQLEGRRTRPSYLAGVNESMRRYAEMVGPNPLPDMEWARAAAENVEEATADFVRRSIHATCWFISENQCERMWQEYGNNGVAIQSTAGRLYEATRNPRPEPSLWFHPVRYVDFEIADNEDDFAFLNKDQSFAHEKELRGFSMHDWNGAATNLDNVPESRKLECDLAILIHTIYLVPGSDSFVLVRDTLDKAGLTHVNVITSELDPTSSRGTGFCA